MARAIAVSAVPLGAMHPEREPKAAWQDIGLSSWPRVRSTAASSFGR
jgi:hypothetical protein